MLKTYMSHPPLESVIMQNIATAWGSIGVTWCTHGTYKGHIEVKHEGFLHEHGKVQVLNNIVDFINEKFKKRRAELGARTVHVNNECWCIKVNEEHCTEDTAMMFANQIVARASKNTR